MTWLAARRKAIAGLIAVILVWGPLAQENGFHAKDWWALAIALAGALGIHAAPNDRQEPPQPWQPAVKMVDGEAGFVDSGGLVMLLIGFLLGVLCVKAGVL